MPSKIRFIALALAVLLALSGCRPVPAPDTRPGVTVPVTTAPTERPSEAPTDAPTAPPTEAPTAPPTQPPTEPPTAPPTQPPTEAPTAPKPTAPRPTEPYSSTDITVGTPVPGIEAKKAFVYDCGTKTFLYMKSEADAKVYPASITKLFTAYVARKYLKPGDQITVGADMLAVVPYDASRANLCAGDRLTVEALYQIMLIPSASDAAHILAVSAGRIIEKNPKLPAQKAEDAFAAEMNRQAAALGFVNSHFVNCDGYPDYNHYTCMADLVNIAALCLDTPLIRDTVCRAEATVRYVDGRTKYVATTNHLLRAGSPYHRKNVRGMKTGTTNAAGACLLSAFWEDGRYMLVGVFQCSGNTGRYSNAVKLYDTYAGKLPPVVTPPTPTEPSAPSTEPSAPSTEPSAPSTEPGTPPPSGPTVTDPASEPAARRRAA